MKTVAALLSVVSAALCGCQSLTVSQQQLVDLTNAVQQVQILYTQIEPYIPMVQEAAQQLLKGEAVGGMEARGDRSPQWRTVRDRYASAHPFCAFCGSSSVDVHHIHPVHLFPSKELDPDNLVSLCRVHHFIYGHGGDWKGFNPDVMVDSEFWKAVKAVREGGR